MTKYLVSFPSAAMVVAAEEWARKIAAARRCSQELREFQYDPATASA